MPISAPLLPLGVNPQHPDVGQPRHSIPGGGEFERLLQQSNIEDTQAQSPVGGARTLVAPTRTHLSGEQAQAALSEAWTHHFGEPPNKATLAILTAQWSLETGRGQSMYNYNFAGIKGVGPSGLSVSQRTREGYGASAETITDSFRAYRSAAEGATDYISLLKRKYGSALEAANQGDPAGFVHELKAGGYFTGNEQLYARSVTQLAQQAMERGVGLLGEGGPLPDQELLVRPVNEAHGAGGGVYGFASQASPDLSALFDEFAANAIADEMSRSALRIAASPKDPLGTER